MDFASSTAAQTALALSALLIVGFGIYCAVYSRFYGGEVVDSEFFITARGSSTKWLIAWSFYASAVGSWVIASVADYAYIAGATGAFFYAFSAGLPIVLVALWGDKIREEFPRVLSLSDYALLRFGRATQVLVISLSLFNMGIATCAEYTTIAALFGEYVGMGNLNVIMVILLAFVTLAYTTYGGLSISIITDQVQAIASVMFVIVVVIYMGAAFRFPADFQGISEEKESQLLGTTRTGYSSILTMPISLLAANVFSEAMWQRVWASESKSALRFGAVVAFIMISCVVMVFGVIGILGGWTGRIDDDTNPNLRVFYTLDPGDSKTMSSAIGIVVLLLSITMSESAVDGLQNGMGASLTGALSKYFAEGKALFYTRLIVVVVNIPLIVVGLLGLQVISLFLIANILCTCGAFPVVLGLSRRPMLVKYHTDLVPITSFSLSCLILVIYGTVREWDPEEHFGANLGSGITMAFYRNLYAWDYFSVALAGSIATTGTLIGVNYVRDRYLNSAVSDDSKTSSSASDGKPASSLTGTSCVSPGFVAP